jgi:hypothetical protein
MQRVGVIGAILLAGVLIGVAQNAAADTCLLKQDGVSYRGFVTKGFVFLTCDGSLVTISKGAEKKRDPGECTNPQAAEHGTGISKGNPCGPERGEKGEELIEKPIKDLVTNPFKDAPTDHTKEPAKVPAQDPFKNPLKDPVKNPVKDKRQSSVDSRPEG